MFYKVIINGIARWRRQVVYLKGSIIKLKLNFINALEKERELI